MADIIVHHSGFLTPEQEKSYVHVPFDIPVQAARLDIDIWYSDQIGSDPYLSGGNTIDIGIFDERGTDFLEAGFRGWTGSERLTFFISETDATPGYLAGALNPGRWSVLLGLYKISPRGCTFRMTVKVTPRSARSLPAPVPRQLGDLPGSPPPAAASPWLRGEVHCHTWHSDGELAPEQLIALARSRGMDFLIVTDHNTIASQDTLAAIQDPPSLILIRGVEVTTFKGHFNVWGIPDWIDFRVEQPAQLEAALQYARDHGALTACNHPKPFGPDWDFRSVSNFDCVEVWNGPWSGLNYISLQYWLDMLAEGHLKPAVGGSDFHRSGEMESETERNIGTPTNWVYVTGAPTPAAILAAIRAGHLSLSNDPDGPFMELCSGAAGEVPMGGSIEWPASGSADFSLRCLRAQGCTLQMLDQNGVVCEATVSSAQETFHFSIPVRVSSYIRAELKDSSGRMAALTNPIYIRGTSAD